MKGHFYPRIAVTNLKKNSQIYIPYILTCIFTIAMFYIMTFLITNEGISLIAGGDQLKVILVLGAFVMAIFSVILLLYTNSFIMKKRKREIGLYNILGMGKRHIAKVMTIETAYIMLITTALGIGAGILLSKLMLMFLARLLGFSIAFGFEISISGIIITVVLFAAIFMLTLLGNLRRIHVAQPVELLHGSNTGEKEPKAKWFLTIIGIAALGTGYYIAITTENPLQAMLMFFVAVLLVIIGTYCLFTACSIALLKLLKRNKKYYYKTKHFTSVSGLMYRMKQNAIGLGNICILSTMVLVMMSGTSSLFIGLEDAIKRNYPQNIIVTEERASAENLDEVKVIINDTVRESGYEVENVTEYRYVNYIFVRNGNEFELVDERINMTADNNKFSIVTFIPFEEYIKLAPDAAEYELKADEVFLYTDCTGPEGEAVSINGDSYRIAARLTDSAVNEEVADVYFDTYYFVMSDEKSIEEMFLQADIGEWTGLDYYYGFDLSCSGEEQTGFYETLRPRLSEYNGENDTSFALSASVMIKNDFLMMYGGLFFLGLFLGIMFIVATVLIMYYKQISEGYEDKKRFEIMQKVGLSRTEIKKTIRSQVLMVFFMPLVMAFVHVIMAFKMITRLLMILGMTNELLYMGCTIGTMVLFALIYTVVYVMTARVYYKIVK